MYVRTERTLGWFAAPGEREACPGFDPGDQPRVPHFSIRSRFSKRTCGCVQ